MEIVLIGIVGLTFVFTVAVVILVMNLQGSLRSTAMQANMVKNQLTYLYERLGEMSDKADKAKEADQKLLAETREQITETLSQSRLEINREIDNVKYHVKLIQERLDEKRR